MKLLGGAVLPVSDSFLKENNLRMLALLQAWAEPG
jgi:hypothetical protein